jgi:probable inorganic polyphosphate/ATP-NAD kinase
LKLGLTANSEIPDAIRVGRRVYNLLKDEDVVLESGIAKLFGKEGKPIEDMDIDVLITVGGDGTILRSLQRTESPIFGINAGVLGFLTEIPENEIEYGLKRLLEGNYMIDERAKLKAEVNGERMYDAMNEAVVHTANVAKIRHFNVYVDDVLAMDVRADGIIVATPTGSTCYAMAVGCPIVDPRVNAITIAPMAPFKFAARPIIVPLDSHVRVEVYKPKPCVCVIDGQQEKDMEGDELTMFSRAESTAKFVSFGSTFYGRMHEKIMCFP